MRIKTLISVVTTALLVYGVSSAFTGTKAYADQFRATCGGIGYDNTNGKLSAVCLDGHAGENWSELDLSTGIANDNGVLTIRQNGGFFSSCEDVHIDVNMGSVILHANCRNNQGTYVYTTVDINTAIGNSNGYLVWNWT